jgi:hypothetical protein
MGPADHPVKPFQRTRDAQEQALEAKPGGQPQVRPEGRPRGARCGSCGEAARLRREAERAKRGVS